jgi:glycosyltransferase involved in cell wall biosynthesis
MKPKLILITGSFPYGHAETFLESEILFLARHFAVTLAPLRRQATARSLPDGVVVDPSLAALFDVPYRKVRSLFTVSFYRILLYHIGYATTAEALKRINAFNSEYVAVRKWLRRTSPRDCILYTYWLNGATLATTDYRMTPGSRVRAVSRIHGYDAYEGLYAPPFFPYRKHILAHIDRLYPIAETSARELAKQGAAPDRIDTSRLGSLDHDLLTRASYPAESTLRIVSVSNFYPVKRVDLIAGAIRALSESLPDRQVVWHHFGEGYLKETVRVGMGATDLPKLTYKFWGQVSNQALFDYYKTHAVDLFINLSHSEGIPVSIMEALSWGIPIVATRVGGTDEIVSHQQNGYLLGADPTLGQILEGIMYTDENFKDEKVRERIKAYWKKKYSAEKAYTQFCIKLMRLNASSSETAR